ncbi:xyloglucan galactosyltransferase XLT2-like [Wolffia australiana]
MTLAPPEAAKKLKLSGQIYRRAAAALLAVQLFLVLLARGPAAGPAKCDHGPAAGPNKCDHGRVFVYDLPPALNRDLVAGCAHLSPFGSRCAALSNHGFGPPAHDLARAVPPALLPAWFATDQFSAELIFHRRMLSSRCRTHDPTRAAAFFVPFYGGLALGQFLWTNATAADRDRHARLLLDWLRAQPAWARSGGLDHFLVLGRISWDFRRAADSGWGSSLLTMPAMANATRLLIERNPWDGMDVAVPYPTGFHPRSGADVAAWQAFVLQRRRRTLFAFAGGPRAAVKDDFRGVLMRVCGAAGGACRSVGCAPERCGGGAAVALFLDAGFCLQPRGDSFTRRSVFDCMVAGAIPVFFWRRSVERQYEWFLPEEVGEFSVFVDAGMVRNGSVDVGAVLGGIGEERARKMREKVVGLLPRIVYALPEEGLGTEEGDAFDVALAGVLRRFRDQRRLWAPAPS